MSEDTVKDLLSVFNRERFLWACAMILCWVNCYLDGSLLWGIMGSICALVVRDKHRGVTFLLSQLPTEETKP